MDSSNTMTLMLASMRYNLSKLSRLEGEKYVREGRDQDICFGADKKFRSRDIETSKKHPQRCCNSCWGQLEGRL